MFLPLNHKKLEVYKIAGVLVKECYCITKLLPWEEKYNLLQQVRRAALSVKLNIAEGSSRRTPQERRRFYEIARGSVIELDAAVETIVDLDYVRKEELRDLGSVLHKCFYLLTGMIQSTN